MSFNPDQERDERGRWSSGGGGGSSVGKSSGSGPRRIERGGVKKLSSGLNDATQKTVDQAKKYFAKELGPKGVSYQNAQGKPLADPFKRSYGKPGTLGEFVRPPATPQKSADNVPGRSGPHHIGDRESMVIPKAGEYYTVAGPKQRSGVFGNAYFRNTQVLDTHGQHIGTLTTKWRGGRTESMTSTASGHSQGAGRGVMGHDVPWLLRTHWANHGKK